MLEANRAINNFKLNYSQAKSRAALARGETTWQCPNNPGGYLYRSPDGSAGPLAEFEAQFKGSIYQFYGDDRKIKEYKKEMHNLIQNGRKYGYMVFLSEEAVKNNAKNPIQFTPERIDKIPAELLETGLENGIFEIRNQDNLTVGIPKAPECRYDVVYLQFDRQRQMARTADLLCSKNHKFAQNPVSRSINSKNHERLRRDVDFITHGMNPDIVRFNEKYGTNLDSGLQDQGGLKDRPIKENFTKEDEAFALFKAIEHFSAPDREELYQYFDGIRQSVLSDKKNKMKQETQQSEEPAADIQSGEEAKREKNHERENGNELNKDASWDALIQKLCQFFIDYTRDPAETLNKFMAEYSDALHKIQNDAANIYHNEFNELINTSEKSVVRHISEELESKRPSKEYITLDKYLKAKDNHIEVYRSFLSDENNADIRLVDADGKEAGVKNVADMNKTEMEALADLIDGGKINMSADGRILESLTNDAYMNIHCDQDMIHRFEKQNMQLLKEELNMFRSMDTGQKKAYIEKNGFDPDAARDAYHYSFHKVNAMEHGQDITGAAMEQLGFPAEKKETILDKRINAYLAAQALHYEHYNHAFEKALASGEPITVYNYKNKSMNPVKIGKLSELDQADRMALVDLIDHDRIFMYAGDKKIEPIYDKYTNPDNYKQGGEFYSPEISETEFRAMAELRSIRDINDKMSNLDNIPANDFLRKKLESEVVYRKGIADHLKVEDAKSTDTYLVSAKYLGLSKKINSTGNLSEYYKRDGADIQKMVSDQIKADAGKDTWQSESGSNPEQLKASTNRNSQQPEPSPGRLVSEAFQILNQEQINGNDLQGEDCSLCLH